jgi:hypothetical protein
MDNSKLTSKLLLSFLLFLILNVSSIPNIFGANENIAQISSIGSVKAATQEPPVSGSSVIDGVLWYTRHENGGISEWTVGGGWNGHLAEDPPASTDPFTDYKVRAEVRRRGNLNEDGSWVLTERDVYYAVRLYLPPDFRVDTGTGDWADGCSLIQIKEHSSAGWGGGLRIRTSSQTFKIITHHYVNGEWVYETLNRDIPFILGRPFTVIIHINAVENGVFESWIDGELVAQDYDDYRMDPTSQDRNELSRYFQVGLYCGIDQNVKEMYFTDAVVANNLEAVQAFLGEN